MPGDPLRVLDLVLAGGDGEAVLGLQEEDVVQLVFRPAVVARGRVEDPGDELDIWHRGLAVRNSQLKLQPPLGRGPDAQLVGLLHLLGGGEGVGAAGVGPEAGEGDLGVAPLLQQQLGPGVEHEETEGSVKEGAAVLDRDISRLCSL